MSRRDGSETGRNIIKFNVLVYGPRSPAITSPRYLLGNREAILYTPIQTSLEHLHPVRHRLSPRYFALHLFRSAFRLGLRCLFRGRIFLTGRKLALVDRGVRGGMVGARSVSWRTEDWFYIGGWDYDI